MSEKNDKQERESAALDALAAAAFSQDLCDEDADDLQRLSATLTPEDRAALDASSKDRLAKLFGGGLPKPKAAKRPTGNLATALNRADEDQELSEAARQEMERKVREAEEAERKKEGGQGQGDADDGRRD